MFLSKKLLIKLYNIFLVKIQMKAKILIVEDEAITAMDMRRKIEF